MFDYPQCDSTISWHRFEFAYHGRNELRHRGMNVHRAVHGRRLQSSALLSEMIYGRFTEGRTLTDYAGNAFLAILTNGKVTEDKVEAHGDLLTEFPYLGPPHNA